jgi:predicted AAA+ superfamily ATPase
VLLERMNPWWNLKKVPTDWLGIKRLVLLSLLPYLPKRMAILLHGVRRVGKSTLMFQMIQHLIDEKVDPYDIIYFTFDESLINLEELLLTFEKEVVKEPLRNKKLYIFLDEIQKHPQWWDKLKLFYDMYPNIKWFLSGSNGLMLQKKMAESLAGRIYSFQIQPLTFPEYLSFHQIPWDVEHLEIQRATLEPYLSRYSPAF